MHLRRLAGFLAELDEETLTIANNTMVMVRGRPHTVHNKQQNDTHALAE